MIKRNHDESNETCESGEQMNSTSTNMDQVTEDLNKGRDTLNNSEGKMTQEQNQTEKVPVSFIFNSSRFYNYLPVIQSIPFIYQGDCDFYVFYERLLNLSDFFWLGFLFCWH